MKPVSETAQYHPLSLDYLNQTPLEHRKKNGQYFTPKNIREELLNLLPRLTQPQILDPACGSGEFLATAQKYYPDSKLFGFDIEPELLQIAASVCPEASYNCLDAIKASTAQNFDLVIGNPPYYEYQPDAKTKADYTDVISGRPNIFALFIKKGLMLLKNGGYLGFVVPPSMNNGAFFKNLRKFILEHASIEKIKILDGQEQFNNARQTVMLLVLRKKTGRKKYVFEKNNLMIFSPNSERLKNLFEGKTTFYEQNFKVRTGAIVWNENKTRLTNNPKGALPLIWSHNIKNGLINLERNTKKPQYIKTAKSSHGPAIVVNRITGSASHSALRASVISEGISFVAENHVNVIFPPTESDNNQCLLTGLAEYLEDTKTAEIIKLITGNTQLSKTELERLVPIPVKLFNSYS